MVTVVLLAIFFRHFSSHSPPLFIHVVLRQCNNYVFLQVILIVVLIFGLSWLPLHIQSLVAMYGTLPRGKYGITLAFQFRDLTNYLHQSKLMKGVSF